MTRLLFISLLASAAAACSRSTPPPSGLILPPAETTPAQGSAASSECSNAGLDQFRGRVATSEVGSQMLSVSRAKRIRWALPGTAMTMEFSPERLTIHLGSGNRIDRAICG